MIFIDRQGEAVAALEGALSGTDYVERLTRELAYSTGKNVVAVNTFDGGVHTALHLCGVKSGDYVFAPTFTFYSYLASITNIGAVPVFLDCDPITRCVSPLALETAFVWAGLQNKPPKAVVIDNAFGSIADYDKLVPMCKAWNVPSIELCTAGGACASNCDYGVISLASDGGGSIVVCGDDIAAAREFTRYEYTDGENHDYRLNNYSAALACAYLTVAPKIRERKKANLAALISALDCVYPPVNGDVADFALCKTDKAKLISAAGFNVLHPPLAHALPKYSGCHYFEHEQGYSVAQSLSGQVLIDMDFSPIRRLKLISLLKGN
ncbi:MAG: DegT/DnrJ/EryC1/StrS family aminotransferase [Clostridiales bacterium]|nr:DegT/DnrJ/EryC1/StrS family aminotransferase [Clostridiales bacterium]